MLLCGFYCIYMRLFYFFSLLCATICAQAYDWQPDSLTGYEKATIIRSDGNQCTVIRKQASKRDVAVLYVHGYNDYFFQKEMGDRFVDSCYNFYAVDLHGYGRSIRHGEVPYQAKSVSEYYEDIDSALAVMRNDGVKEVALMGHSNGGLITASFLNDKPDAIVKVLILNSPFLEWNMSGAMRKVAIPGVARLGRLFPNMSVSQGNSTAYGESLLSAYHGEWNYNVEWKTMHPRKVTAGWIRMIRDAQKRLRKNKGNLNLPILLMHSAMSVNDSKWTELHQKADAVLNVDDICNQGSALGPDVTDVKIYGGMHDLILSEPKVREEVYNSIFEWLHRHL